jgi:flavin reductase (DIM6/NTAB) family NADH-FMN oxidoreductase RutF
LISREVLSLSKPSQPILVSSKGTYDLMGKQREVDNLITIGWHMAASYQPPIYIICIGKDQFSLSLIRQTRVFAVNFMGKENEKEMLFCGKNSGARVDKYKETGLTPLECEAIDCKYVKEALAVYECEVINEIESGDHILVVGKILKSRKLRDGKRLLHLGGNDFTTTMR